MRPIYEIDYETFYSKDYSIRDLGNWAYTHHPEFDAYLLTVSGPGDYSFCGHPTEFDWRKLKGAIVGAHNAGFEWAVTQRLVELGKIPQPQWDELVDSADIAAYFGFPRSLAEASKHMLGVELDKGVRDRAKGKRWSEMTPEFQQEMMRYATQDSVSGRQILMKYLHLWPDWERELSRRTREMTWRGLPVDREAVDQGVKDLETLLWTIRGQIPWAEDPDAKPLSPKAVAEECRRNNITPPKSMAKDSEDFALWLKENGDSLPWARAIGSYRSANMLLKKLKTMQMRIKPDGWMPYGLKYAGAHTLRDSGDAGWNPQNLPREAMFGEELTEALKQPHPGIDMRQMITAPDGYLLWVADSEAIEPRILNYFAEDWEFLELLRKGYDPYEGHARVTGEYTDPRPLKEVDKDFRQYKKVDVLGMGYGAGPEKVQWIAKVQFGIDMTLAEAEQRVRKFRSRPYIPRLWGKLEGGAKMSGGSNYEIELPSGRVMLYRDVRTYGGVTAVIPKGGKLMRLGFWGGTFAENITQACARDVVMWQALEICRKVSCPLLRVHDELVGISREKDAERDLKKVLKIMSTPPSWMAELPVAAAGYTCKKYIKK